MHSAAKRIVKTSVAVLGLYIAAYSILSLTGGYVLTQSGDVRYAYSGLSVSDIFQWQPRFGFFQLFRQTTGALIIRADRLDYVFAPLILFDQAVVHKSIRLFDPETGKRIEERF